MTNDSDLFRSAPLQAVRSKIGAIARRAPHFGRRLSTQSYAAIFALLDALALIGWGLRTRQDSADGAWGSVGSAAPFWSVLLAVLLHFVVAQVFHVYQTDRIFDRRRGLARASLSFACTFAVLTISELAAQTMTSEVGVWLVLWGASCALTVLPARHFLLTRATRLLRADAYVRRAMSVGVFCDPLQAADIEKQTGGETRVFATAQLARLSDLVDLSDEIAHREIDVVYIAAPWHDIPAVLNTMKLLSHLSTRVLVLPSHRVALHDINQVSMFGDRIAICASEESIHGWSLWLKRLEDVSIAAMGLIALSPLFLVVAALIRIDSPGPIFFRQPRVGFNGRTFALWKFRSMYQEMTDPHAKVQTRRDDPRVTRVGRLIRRTSIDELPQLINVLQGTMSIVGPRPHALSTQTMGQNLEELVDYYAVRHRVKPGMTGWAQIHGYRGELDSIEKLQKRVDFDLFYIDNWSIWLDTRIVLSTMLLMFRDSHAY